MKLKNQVCSLELSKKLEELGVKQSSLFWWVKGKMDYGYEGEWWIEESNDWFIFDQKVGYEFNRYDLQLEVKRWEDESSEEFEKWRKRQKRAENKFLKENIISAFTSAELGEILPNGIDYIITTTKQANRWLCRCEYIKGAFREELYYEWAETEVDVRALVLIYLLENKIIKLRK